jgi:O-antigen biosynthesis protein
MQVRCPASSEADCSDVTVVDHVKMIRNHPQLRFEGRIHEQVLPSIRRLGGAVEWTDIFVVHSGADQTAEGRRRKQERDLRLLLLDLTERPEHPFVLFNLGMTYSDVGSHDEAVAYLQRCVSVSQPGESHLRKAYALLSHSLAQLGRHVEAQTVCQHALELFPADPELHFRDGLLAHHFHHLSDAERAYRAALQGPEERQFSSVDGGISGFKARHNLAIVYADMGRFDLAEVQWRVVLEEVPTHRTAWRSLVESLLAQRRWMTAGVAIEQMSKHESLLAEAAILKGKLAMHAGDPAGARAAFGQAVQDYPDDVEAHQALGQFLFEHGDPKDAIRALSDLVRRVPKDGSAHHNLGTLYLRDGQFKRAAESFRESLRIRPASPSTYLQLSYALEALGRHEEAEAARQESERQQATLM